jgi:outer membrane protein assembly factor BamA
MKFQEETTVVADQNEAVLSLGYSSDKRDSAIYPMSGYKYDISSEVTLPLLDMQVLSIKCKSCRLYSL